MDVLIYGGGAVGLGVSSFLLKFGARVTIVGREGTVEALGEGGLVRSGIFGDFRAGPAEFGCCCGLEGARGRTFDYALVCTKSSGSRVAAADISEHKEILGNDGKIVLFQNGWGNAEIFLEFFGKEQVFNARVITGFTRPKLNEVLITVHADPIHIGSLFGVDSSEVGDLSGAINDGGMPCETTETVERDLWAKMLYNCALNPLGAILDAAYGKLAEHDSTRSVMDGIVGEAFAVMRACGYSTHWGSSEDFLEVFYGRLVPDTAEHKSSTLQDITAGKQTEIEALNGAVIRLAQEQDMDVRYNRAIYNIIKFIEAGKVDVRE